MKVLKLTLGALMCMCLFGCSNQETKKQETNNVPKIEEKKVAEEKKSEEQVKADTEEKVEEKKEETPKVEEKIATSSSSSTSTNTPKKENPPKKEVTPPKKEETEVKSGSGNATVAYTQWQCIGGDCSVYTNYEKFQKHRIESGHDKLYNYAQKGEAQELPSDWNN